MRSVLALLLVLSACDSGAALPAGKQYEHPKNLRATVEVLREVGRGTPLELPSCGALAVSWRSYTPDGSNAGLDLGAAGDPVGFAQLYHDDKEPALVAMAAGGETRVVRGRSCSWGSGWTAIAPIIDGVARTVSLDADRLLVGWSDGPRVVRSLRCAAGAWYEEPLDEPPGLSIRRTWFVRSWHGRIYYGLDAGEAYTTPPLPDPESWRLSDPMGATEVRIDGRPHLFVGGLPSRSHLYDVDGKDLAEEAGVRGPELLVTWQSSAVDLNGDGRDDIVAVALAGHNSQDGRPAQPRVLVQIDGGRFASLPVGGPRIYAHQLACLGATCAATAFNEEGVLFRVTVQ